MTTMVVVMMIMRMIIIWMVMIITMIRMIIIKRIANIIIMRSVAASKSYFIAGHLCFPHQVVVVVVVVIQVILLWCCYNTFTTQHDSLLTCVHDPHHALIAAYLPSAPRRYSHSIYIPTNTIDSKVNLRSLPHRGDYLEAATNTHSIPLLTIPRASFTWWRWFKVMFPITTRVHVSASHV